MADAIECRDLVVRYGPLVAVDHLSLAAEPGSVVALLGPNGAGKTSTVETLEGFRRPAAGTVRVLGLDPIASHRALVARIGVMLQRGGIYPTMGARRVLDLFAHYYEDPEDTDALLDLVGLTGVARTPWRRLSGGEQQRLSLALALVGRPPVLFLDEPTAGVDPEGRIAIRRVIGAQRERGACILLTTHELPEAERLADKVVIVARGRAVARGTVADLAARSTQAIEFAAPPGADLGAIARALGVDRDVVVEEAEGRYAVKAPPTPARLAALAGWLAERDLPLQDLRAGHRSLEDVYLEVTRAALDGTLEDAGLSGAPEPASDRGGARGANGGAWARAARTAEPDAAETDVAETGGDRRPAPAVLTDLAPGAVTPGRAEAAGVRAPNRSPEGWAIRVRRIGAQTTAEVGMTLRRGESLLLTLGIPVVLLAFFSQVHLLPVGTGRPVSFLAPGILALAVMSTALVNLSIATGFERGYGVLKRLGATPLGRPALLGAKIAAVVVVEVLQMVVLVPVALGLGWRPSAAGAGVAIGIVLLATAGFAGLGLLFAGVLRAEVNLAAANGLWLLLLLVSGMLAPLSKLPGWLQAVAKVLPAAPLARGLHDALGLQLAVPAWCWVVLACWAVAAPVAAALTFRWE